MMFHRGRATLGAGVAVVLLVTGCAGTSEARVDPVSSMSPSAQIPAETIATAADADRVENLPALQPYDASEPLVPVESLLARASAANGLDGDGVEADAPVYAASLAYGDVTKYSPRLGEDARIAADRPMWVLSVHGRMQNYGSLPGASPVVWDVYTAVFDGPTGAFMASGPGDIEELGIPGTYIR
ncbi:hypothetical protein [Rathayibacter sp. VKM Ac-2927]|uniref:hypothetical protein n=1 Tax=Rathayibacter sp. VKM Ac-2927 TaxID=2929478 RepID=UPI001FB3ABAD|nr:hypothetical protein [Rathayibacter sp. VKM Ac-2927]MCJ1688614.1 hypothetical protein [Rathayibacter sp. VKM Ac-2927]